MAARLVGSSCKEYILHLSQTHIPIVTQKTLTKYIYNVVYLNFDKSVRELKIKICFRENNLKVPSHISGPTVSWTSLQLYGVLKPMIGSTALSHM